MGSSRDDREWAAVERRHEDAEHVFAARRARPPRRRARGGRALVVVAVLTFILGLGVGYARDYFSTGGSEGPLVTVTVPEGASLSDIAQRLEDEGVVKHARAFAIRAESDGYASKLKPGTYRLHRNEPYDALVAALVRGVAPRTVKVTIPEGSTLRQTAALAADRVGGFRADQYVKVAAHDPPPVTLEGYAKGTTLEGLLFPATYEVKPRVTARAFIDEQLAAFNDNFSHVDMSRARKAQLTAYDVVIIASMVEREARVAEERPLVAAVIWNRLRDGMRLQIDATIQYALGKTKPVLTYNDLKVDSPYNTYTHAGLPPTPIANPGLAALQAAADPADVDYLYYVARADGTGRHYFTASYEQFLVDKQKAAANAD